MWTPATSSCGVNKVVNSDLDFSVKDSRGSATKVIEFKHSELEAAGINGRDHRFVVDDAFLAAFDVYPADAAFENAGKWGKV